MKQYYIENEFGMWLLHVAPEAEKQLKKDPFMYIDIFMLDDDGDWIG